MEFTVEQKQSGTKNVNVIYTPSETKSVPESIVAEKGDTLHITATDVSPQNISISLKGNEISHKAVRFVLY